MGSFDLTQKKKTEYKKHNSIKIYPKIENLSQNNNLIGNQSSRICINRIATHTTYQNSLTFH